MRGWFRSCPFVSVGVLAGELCVCLITELYILNVWARTTKDAWYQVFSIVIHGPEMERCFTLIPLKYLSDGSLMFYSNENAFLHVDPEKSRYQYLKINMKKMNCRDSVAHIPSLVSLKHSLLGQNVQVPNLQSRKSQNFKAKFESGRLYSKLLGGIGLK